MALVEKVAAILHRDFPDQVLADSRFTPTPLPVNAEYLRGQGLSDTFVTYMKNFAGFLAAE